MPHPDPPADDLASEIEGLRRRAGDLAALFASARELAAMGDADAVLERLVERAQELLAADVAYLSEFDAGDATLRVRVTRGAVTAALRELVVPPGRGLVSAIVESRLPRTVRRYDAVAAERHASGVDAAVEAEGIVSLLGVPLLSDTAVLGVLFVAERRERAFSPDDVAVLAALADHAAVVVRTAAALDDARRQAQRAEAAVAELTAHVAARDRAHRVHRELVDAVLAGGGLAPVAATLSSALRAPVAIVDERGLVRAGDPAAVRGATVRRGIDDSRDQGRPVRIPDAGIASAIVAGGRTLGAIVVGPADRPLDEVDLRTLERAGQVAALLALSDEAVAAADHRERSDLLVDLVTASPQRRADVDAAARRVGVDPAGIGAITVVEVAAARRAETARALAQGFGPAALVGELDGLVVAAHPSPLDADAYAAIRSLLATPVLAVTAPVEPVGLARTADDARAALALARALGLADVRVDAVDLLPYAATIGADPRVLEIFLDAAIGPVRRHDAARGSDLLATLRAFVRHGASPTRTARALTFHTNTILQRLDKLEVLLGAGWRDDERFFRLSTAVRLDELRERLGRTGGG